MRQTKTSILINLLGSFEDFPTVLNAMKGVYGVWSNTDGFTVGEAREIYAGMRIFELAKQAGTVRHYIWSSLDYATKVIFVRFNLFLSLY